jgi:hypothetical protein
MIRRLLLPTAAVVLQLVAAMLGVGVPDVRLAADFFVGYPTAASSLAAAQLLVWTLIAVGCVWTLVLAAREMRPIPGRIHRRFWEGSVLLMGILILMGGVARGLTYEVPMEGGTVAEAQRALEVLYPIGR